MRRAPSSSFRSATIGLLASTMLSGAGTAYAQDKPSTGPATTSTAPADEDEIVVTAQKREENLQDVPISIQALGTQRLDEANVSNFNEYTKLTPTVSFQTTQPGSTNVYIRGVASGGDGNHSGSLPSVGVYLDEQPVTTIGGTLDVHIYDIARIEVLRGPQGTLYGASSEAGTIRIITNKPDKTGSYGGLDVEGNSVDHGGQGGKIEGFFNLPLSERAALRVVGWYQHDAGFIDNVPGARSFLPQPGGLSVNNSGLVKKNFNDIDVAGARAALGIDLTDNWTATASLFGQDQKSRGTFGFEPSVGDLQVQHFYPDRFHDRYGQAALTIEGKISNWDVTYAGAYLDRQIHSTNDYTDYAEAYDSLYSGSGGVANNFYYLDNAGNHILPLHHIVGRDHFTKMSHELRLASPSASRFRIVAGLFYQRQTHRIHQDYQVTGLGSQVSVNGFPGTLWLTQQDRVDRDYAAFGEATFDVTSTVALTGGIRAYKYDNSLIGFFGYGRNPAGGFTGQPFNAGASSRTGYIACFTSTGAQLRDNLTGTLLPAAVPGSPCTNLGTSKDGKVVPKSTTGDGFTHRVNLTWKITPDHMVYATWSKGFRPGGINRRSTLPPYAEDTLTNYELGLKTSWGKLRVNGAVYLQDWKSFQYSFLGQNSFTEIHNGPDARIKGAELDVFWRPATGLTLNGSAAYTDAKTRQKTCKTDDPTFSCTGPDISAPKGTRLPVTPQFKASGTGRYEFPVGGGTGHLQTIVTHQGSSTADLRTDEAALLGRLKAYTMFDFSLGMEWRKITAELFFENAFDERAELTRYSECSVCTRVYVVPYAPRTIGLRLGTKF
ncbi:MAG: TonB-dependent receptor [Alphaproteobacteria bacterium]|nr:TonB-dependent receptor [Alphaproteobacteria bacterium]